MSLHLGLFVIKSKLRRITKVLSSQAKIWMFTQYLHRRSALTGRINFKESIYYSYSLNDANLLALFNETSFLHKSKSHISCICMGTRGIPRTRRGASKVYYQPLRPPDCWIAFNFLSQVPLTLPLIMLSCNNPFNSQRIKCILCFCKVEALVLV